MYQNIASYSMDRHNYYASIKSSKKERHKTSDKSKLRNVSQNSQPVLFKNQATVTRWNQKGKENNKQCEVED